MSFPRLGTITCWSVAIAALPFTVMNARLAARPLMGGTRRTPVAGSAAGESAPAGHAAVHRRLPAKIQAPMDPSSIRYLCPYISTGTFAADGQAAMTTPLKPAKSLNLADLPLDLAGYPFKFAVGSQRCICTDPPGDHLERTTYSVEDPSCPILGAEFHDRSPCCLHNPVARDFTLPGNRVLPQWIFLVSILKLRMKNYL